MTFEELTIRAVKIFPLSRHDEAPVFTDREISCSW
jgi:hypothetical protein